MEFDEFDQARSVPPPPAVRDRQPLRHALRGTATSSILSWSCGNRVAPTQTARRMRCHRCAMGSHGPIESEVRTDPSAAPAPGNQAVLKLEDFLPYQLNVVASLTSQALSRVYARRYRIGVPEWRVLVTLGQYGVMTGKAVGAHSHMHKTKVSRAVALLEKRRLLVRRANREDMREAFLSLTAAGRAMYEELAPHALDFARRLTEILTPQDREAFNRAVQQLTARSAELAAEVVQQGKDEN
jgi:DNA-binding MarR family transcriptional regulator